MPVLWCRKPTGQPALLALPESEKGGAMNSDDWYTKNRFYMASYVTDDGRARRDCEAVLVFGKPAGSPLKGWFDWKWVDLPCPSCQFTHFFKRVAWVDEWPLGILTEEDRAFLTEVARPRGK